MLVGRGAGVCGTVNGVCCADGIVCCCGGDEGRGLLVPARSGADNCGGDGKPLLCLLPPSMNVQRGEGRSLRLPFISLFLLMRDIFN